MASVAVGSNKEKGVASYSRPECSPLRRLHDTCMPDSRGSAARQAASTSREIMDSWLMSQSEYARAGFIRWLGRPMDQNLHLCMWLFSSPSIPGSSCHSGLGRSLGHRSIGIRPPHTWCLSAWRTLLLQGKANGHTSSPVIDMEPPQH